MESGPARVLARGAANAAVLSAFGALLFLAALAPPALRRLGGAAPPLLARLRGIAWASLAGAGLLALAWATMEAARIGGSPRDLGLVLADTLFGHLVLARLALLALTGVALAASWPRAATLLAGLAVASVAGHGHALAMYEGPSWLLLSEVLHLLAAGAWLGGLLPLAALVASSPPEIAALASRRFSPLGTACVLLIAGSALVQASVLVGSLAGLVGTAYGLVALLKAALFLLLLGFAARNRFRLTPALEWTAPALAKARLVRSVAGETGIGLLVVIAAGLLTSLTPAMHAQPVWPFPWRLSLEAVSEDPAYLREVVTAGVVALAALALAAAAFLSRWRLRWVVAALAAVVVWRAAPHLGLLLAEADPTWFWTSPTGFSSASVAEGKALYPAHCARCHGPDGRGDGPSAASLPVPPADLTAGHLWAHPDGELFWWLSHGMEGPDGQPVMPGFAGVLTEAQRWALMDWIKANNAGLARRASGTWPVPVQAPGFALACTNPDWTGLADLHGQVVRIAFGVTEPVPGAVTVVVDADAGPRPGVCTTADPSAATAYAAVTGLTVAELAGADILVDRAGWLRAVLRRRSPDDGELARAVDAIGATSLERAPPGHAGMRM